MKQAPVSLENVNCLLGVRKETFLSASCPMLSYVTLLVRRERRCAEGLFTNDMEVGTIVGRAYTDSTGSETCVRHRPPVFVKPSRLPAIRPRPSCDANIDIPK